DGSDSHTAVVEHHAVERSVGHRPGPRAGVGEITVHAEVVHTVLNHRLWNVVGRTNVGRNDGRTGRGRTAAVGIFALGQVQFRVQALLFHVRKNGAQPGAELVWNRRLRALGGRVDSPADKSNRHEDTGGEAFPGVVIVVQGQPNLFEIVLALDPPRSLPYFFGPRHQQTGKQCNCCHDP